MELIIAEKPSVGRTIAAVVGATESRDGYMEGRGMIVSWCIGHLVELAKPENYKQSCVPCEFLLFVCFSYPWYAAIIAQGTRKVKKPVV